MAFGRAAALADAGLVKCGACGNWDETFRMRINADGSQWLCGNAAVEQVACADEQVACGVCGAQTTRRDLDLDGECGCLLAVDHVPFVPAAVLS